MSKQTSDAEPNISDFLAEYIDNVREGFEQRWSQIKPDVRKKHTHECIGGLLSRQATLAIVMARSPYTWSPHAGYLFFRCMADAYITMKWILESPEERSEKYILYGLGQLKLFIEACKQEASIQEGQIKQMENWLNTHRADWATEVNVGSWSGISTRKMAEEIGEESFYRFIYAGSSASLHNAWHHVAMYNLRSCLNPLHLQHQVPYLPPMEYIEFYGLYMSAKYVSMTYKLFDEKMGTTCDVPTPLDFYSQHPLINPGEEENDDH